LNKQRIIGIGIMIAALIKDEDRLTIGMQVLKQMDGVIFELLDHVLACPVTVSAASSKK
jgi:hypothetical protein